jgi:sedoheptulokinase
MAGRLSQSYAAAAGLPAGIPVMVPLGDNQASILATAKRPDEEIYLTLGTGAQLSIILSRAELAAGNWPESVEIRPYPGDRFLAVAAPLCGGQAMAWLADNINHWLHDLGFKAIPQDQLYRRIDRLAGQCPDSPLFISPSFLGERHQPQLRGEIRHLDLGNASLGNVASALARGIIANLYGMVPETIIKSRKLVIGSGNAVRRLAIMRKMIRQVFSLPLKIVANREEAATGAALFAAKSDRGFQF